MELAYELVSTPFNLKISIMYKMFFQQHLIWASSQDFENLSAYCKIVIKVINTGI